MKKIISINIFLFLTIAVILSVAIPAGSAQASLVGYFPFEGTATDSTGHIIATSYTAYNTVGNLTYTAGPVGQAVYFDGTGDHIMFNANTPIIYGSNSTTMFWAKRDPTANTNGINDILLSRYNGADITAVDTEAFSIKYSEVDVYKGVNTPILTAVKNPTNDWVHITITDDGSKLRYYENGVEKPNVISTYTSMNGTKASYMAMYRTNHFYRYSDLSWVYYYKGWLDEFKVYDTALTINDIKTEYCKGNSSDPICVVTPPVCSTNSQCGTSGLTGSPFCQSGNVYQNYVTYTCNNPGAANSLCSNSTAAMLQTTCSGSQTCSNGSCTTSCTQNSQQRCVGSNLFWYDSCGNQGNLIQYCANGCSGNACVIAICNNNSQCGTSGLTGSPFCQSGNVYQNYVTYTCNNPGAANSSCSNSTAAMLQTTCTGSQTCSNGSCTTSDMTLYISGENPIIDESSSHHQVTNVGVTSTNLTSHFGNSLSFNSASYLNAIIPTPLAANDDFTWDMWVYRNSSTGGGGSVNYRRYISHGGSSYIFTDATNGILGNNSLQVGIAGNITLQCGPNCLPQNSWHRITITRYGSTAYLFVDGLLKATDTTSAYGVANIGTDLLGTIGAYSTGSNSFNWEGYIDEINLTRGADMTLINGIIIACSTNSQCGTTGLTGSPFCQGNNVYQNYIAYTCNNPGTAGSSCSNSTTAQLQTTCTGSQTCNNGSCTTPITGLAVYFPFEGTTTDSTGHIIATSYNTYNTVGSLTYTNGKVGQAAYFDGTGDHIMFNTNTPITYSSNSTTMFWAKRDPTALSNGSNDIFLSKYQGADINAVDQQILSLTSSSANVYKVGNTPILTGVKNSNDWVHIGIVDNGMSLKYYLNGVEMPNVISAYTPMNGISASYMGMYRTNHFYRYSDLSWVYYYKGWIDEFKLYNNALSASDVKTEYCKGNPSDVICTGPIACSTNSQCGTSNLIGSPFCQYGNVYQNYIAYTCNNPGTAGSSCSNSTAAMLQTTCTGSQTCSNGSCTAVACSTNSQCGTTGLTGSPFCQGNNVYQNYIAYTCNNPGTAGSSCSNSTTAQLQTTCTGSQTCNNGSCNNQTIICSNNTQCGTNNFTGSPFCQGSNVYQNYITYTCHNSGTANSYCSDSTTPQLQTTCTGNQTCTNGSCTTQIIACANNAACGTSGLTGSLFCQGNSIYQNYIAYTCNNPGTASSSCSSSTTAQLQTTCTGSQICSNGSCSTNCTQNSQQRCVGSNLYWYDSCGVQGNLIQYCANGCSGNACIINNCTQNSQQRCVGSSLYWYDSCGVQGGFIQYCANGCLGNTCNNNYNNCTYHSSERCIGNSLYWYDSCGVQQDLAQYCTNGCVNNYCTNNYSYYGNCTYHAYKLCTGNNIYWYDSCGTQQDLYTTCGGGQTCQYGQCTYPQTYSSIQYVQPQNTYISHYRTACNGGSLSWYDSLGSVSGIYQNCTDNNSCTLDTCAGGKCSNISKCDGTTCTVGSADYNTYCAANHCGNGLCESTLGETNANCPADCKIVMPVAGLTITFLTKNTSTSNQWQKQTEIDPNSQAYFMISVVNSSTSQIDNVSISANIPVEISSIGNLQLNGVPVSGDIISGINIGSISPAGIKTITFEGKTQAISATATKQATATSNVLGTIQSDYVTINLSASKTTAAVSESVTSTGFWGFLKNWYLWILGAIVLVFLFVVVFKRFSSDV